MSDESTVHSDRSSFRLRWPWLALVALLLALVGIGGWIYNCCVPPSLEAEKTLHATLFAVGLVERFVTDRGRWPRSWSELEDMPMVGDLLGERWPAAAAELRRRVAIDFEIDPMGVARQDPTTITAIRPIGPHYEFRDSPWVKSLQEAILKSMTEPPSQESARSDEPVTIAASCVGRFSRGRSWYLSVNSAGEAELTIDTVRQPTRRKFVVPGQKLAELRRALEQERFFDLADEYGELVPDSSTQSITVSAGDRAKTVRVHFLMNWVHQDRAKLLEPSRAVRILVMIRGWFDDTAAAGGRP